MLKKITLVAMLIFPMCLMAQNLKFAHMDATKIISLMPEHKRALAELDSLQSAYQKMQQEVAVEFQTKYEAFMKEQATLPTNIAERKRKELQDLQNRAQQYEQEGYQDLQAANTRLMQPILKKLDEAVQSVGQEGGYVYIFDVARTPVAYVNDAISTDVTAKVKAKLGIVE